MGNQDKPPSKDSSFEDKVKDQMKNVRGTKEEDFMNYAKDNKESLATYALLIVGLLSLLFSNLVGGIIIGAVAGYYFSLEITSFLRGIKNFFSGQDRLRSLSFIALLVALLFASPGIFIGAAIVAAVKQQFFS